MKHKKIKFVAGSICIVFALGYLIFSGVSTNAKFFFTVDELAAAEGSYRGQGLKVKGKVVNGSINRDAQDYLNVSFSIEEKKAKLPVVYKGVTPDMFEDGREVVVEGTIDNNGVFHANTLLTSCPSKYEAEKEAGKSHPGNIPMGNGDKPVLEEPKILPKATI